MTPLRAAALDYAKAIRVWFNQSTLKPQLKGTIRKAFEAGASWQMARLESDLKEIEVIKITDGCAECSSLWQREYRLNKVTAMLRSLTRKVPVDEK